MSLRRKGCSERAGGRIVAIADWMEQIPSKFPAVDMSLGAGDCVYSRERLNLCLIAVGRAVLATGTPRGSPALRNRHGRGAGRTAGGRRFRTSDQS